MATIVIGCDDYVGQWVCREVGKLWVPGAGKALGWQDEEGNIVAGVTFTNYDGRTVWMDCAATPGSRWLDRRGLFVIFHYVFEQLGCARASAMVPEDNDKSRKLLEQAGFEQETSLKKAAPDGGRMFIYTLFKEDCRWLRRRK